MNKSSKPHVAPPKHPPRETAPGVRTMHDDVDPCSDDICCCEPEPRWQQLDGDDTLASRLDPDSPPVMRATQSQR